MANVHADAARRVGMDLAVAAGSNPERARELAERTGATFFDNYERMLADPSIAGVDVCVPNDRHRAYVLRALAAGKDVLCEKPIALTLEDADAMIAAAAANGDRVLMVAHVMRFWPEYLDLRERITHSEAGEPRWLILHRLTDVLGATKGTQGWRADPSRCGGAALDLQIHDIDFACWLFGAPRSVYSSGVQSASGAWDHVVTVLNYDRLGVSIEGSFIQVGAPLEISFELIAHDRTLAYRYSPRDFALHQLHGSDASEPGSLIEYRAPGDPRPLLRPKRDSFAVAVEGELLEFVHAIEQRRVSTSPAEEARLALSVALASVRSCETGEAVQGPF